MENNNRKQAIQTEEVKGILVNILEYFDEICKKHDIRYSLGYGTLLGAARHNGFIPWDDDIDVMLPEPDYQRFIRLPELQFSSSKYKIHTIERENLYHEVYPYPFAKLVDERTMGIYMRTKDTFGAYIDVFPIVGVPDDEKEFKRYFWEFESNKLKLSIGYRIDRDMEGLFVQRLKKVRRDFYWRRYSNYRDKLANNMVRYNYEQSSRVNVSYWNYGEKETFPRSMFEKYTEIKFEGKSYPCIVEYDSYLQQMYGDWHQLPPKNMRKPRHEYQLFYK